MANSRERFRAWLSEFARKSETLLKCDLRSPRDAFYMSSTSQDADAFFAVVERWRGMVRHLLTGLRSRLLHPDDWLEDAKRTLDISQLLRFSVRDVDAPGRVERFDLNDRMAYSDWAGVSRMRRAFEHGREEPDWRAAIQAMTLSVRNQLAALQEIDEADLVDPEMTEQGLMGKHVTININSPMHQSPINVGGRQHVRIGADLRGDAFQEMRAELAEVREAILTNQDLILDVRRAVAAAQWDALLPALHSIVDRMQTVAGTRELSPDEVGALATRAVRELELEKALDRDVLQHPIIQNLAASGIWSVLARIATAAVG